MRFTIRQAQTLCLVLLACGPFHHALAQSPPDTAPAPASAEIPTEPTTEPTTAPDPALPAATPPAPICCALPDGTLVELAIGEPLTSKTAQRGQRFKLLLAEPLRLGDTVVLPAGTEGVGEIIHADRARAAGKPGELLLAARFLQGPDGEIKLRGMKLGGSGKDHGTAAMAVATALGPVGFFVRGGQIEIETGTRAHAKLAGPLKVADLAALEASSRHSGDVGPAGPSTPSSTSEPADAPAAPASGMDTPPAPAPPHH
jgi:hypothetical protein